MISVGHWYAQMTSQCVGWGLQGHDIELVAALEECTLLVSASISEEAVALGSHFSMNSLVMPCIIIYLYSIVKIALLCFDNCLFLFFCLFLVTLFLSCHHVITLNIVIKDLLP